MKKEAAPKKKVQTTQKTATVKAKPAVRKTAVKAVKKSALVKKAAVPVKKSAPVKKAAVPVKKSAPVKKAAATVKKAAPVKKAAATVKKAAPVKKVAATVKKTAAVKKAVEQENKKSVPMHKKNRLSATQKKHYITLLKDLRRTFSSQLRFHQDEALTTKKDSAGERAGMATHMADLGSDNFRHDLELGLMTEEGDVLEMIEEALQKIENNEYGICADCECLINPERLEAKPYARYCVRCKDIRERMEEPHHRHR